ncbi:MAG: hypothetical protein M3Q92_10070 [Actinomycetota bacterium]|nr:hypothetical protein [Actinomycetota bacterium]
MDDDDADEHGSSEQAGKPPIEAPVEPAEEPMPTLVPTPEDDPVIRRRPVEPPGV